LHRSSPRRTATSRSGERHASDDQGSGKTNQFIVELRDGIDTIRCAVHIEGSAGKPDADLEPAAIARAVTLASSLGAAFTVDNG
jgi:hypothetical protein